MKWYASKKMLSFVILLFLSAVLGGFFFVKALVFDKPKTSTYVAEDGTVYERTNILLLGIDARPGETRSRTDTIILASIDPESHSVALLSIPRDTLVSIPGHGENKINAANVFGGPELTKQVVEDLTGVPINYHVMTNFDGFKDIIDTLGGVTINVEKNMIYKNEGIQLTKGIQELDGDKALQYVRFRSDAMGDIGRTQRQQSFLKAIANEALQLKTVVKLPKLMPQISEMVETNMSVTEMAHLAKAAKDLQTEKLVAQTLPGNFYNYKGISYWKVDEKSIKSTVQALLNNGVTENVIDSNVVSAPKESKPKIKVNEKAQPNQNVDKSTETNETGTGNGDPVGTTDTNGNGTGSAGTGSTGTGSTGTGSVGTGSTGTGSTETGSTETGSTGTGSTGTGSTGTGSTDTGSTGTGSTGTGSTGTGSTGTGSTGTGSTGTGSAGTGITDKQVPK